MIVIALPAYNEAATIESLLVSIRQSMLENAIEYRIVVVNDGSEDKTGEVVESMVGAIPLQLITHPENLGLGEAIRSGLLAALEDAKPQDIIVTMDSDNTHTPGLIARMVRGIR